MSSQKKDSESSSCSTVCSVEEYSVPSQPSKKLRVTFLASEWGSSKGGLSTINRELAINVAKDPDVNVTVFVPQCNDEDKKAALTHKINLIKAKRRPGLDELEWLNFPPNDLQIDVVVGHGVKLGHQAPVIRESHNCKWVQVVHTAPEELGMHKTYSNPISVNEKKHKTEVELCKMADFVATVGPKLSETFRCYLRGCNKDQTVFEFTPGILSEFSGVEQVVDEGRKFRVLVFGRGDEEDFELKGFDIVAKAVATLDDTHLILVGAPDGRQDEVKNRLLECGISAQCLTVRSFLQSRENLRDLLCEVDLAVMPSRTEGFGLTGLEALSAGLPILVSGNSGFGEALSKVPFGSFFVIDSQDPKEWAKAIKQICTKDRRRRLQESESLRTSYQKEYSWETQTKSLIDKMISMTRDASVACPSSTTIPLQARHTAINSEYQQGTLPIVITIDSVTFQSLQSKDPEQQEKAKLLVMTEMTKRFLETHAAHIKAEDYPLCLDYYLKGVLDLIVREAIEGSLRITVECTSLKILERLWEDYSSGHLNEEAEKRLLTDDIKTRFDVESVKLHTTILEEDYLACKLFLVAVSEANENLPEILPPDQTPVEDETQTQSTDELESRAIHLAVNCEHNLTQTQQQHNERQQVVLENVFQQEAADVEEFPEYLEHQNVIHDSTPREESENNLRILVKCHDLESLERLWEDYRSGRLNIIAEKRLVTDDIKRKFHVESVNLATTILEDDYLACKELLSKKPLYQGSNDNTFGKRELELREYQKELAAPAIKGNNTIICAPTNSGKTYVAIEIAKQHLDSFSTEDANAATGGDGRKVPKVVFIVSTVNLVLQQKERFQYFLTHKYRVGDISGINAREIPLKYLLKNNDVVVLTAQILVNALNSSISEEKVELSDISLLLFYECHHADKEHSYNRIMEKYLALKNQAGKQHKLPQIVGFTAFLGTGSAQSVEKAEKHILLLSANLDAKVISTVKNNEEELKKYANVPKRKIFHIPKTNQDPFGKIVSQVMDKIEALIKKPKGKSYKPGPPDKAGQQYRQWIEELYKESIAEGDRFLVTCSEQLREYHVALTINASTTMKNAKTRLQKYFDSLNEEKFLTIDVKLKKLFVCAMTMLEEYVKEHGESENPLIMQLKELLLENYEDVKRQKEKDAHGKTSEAKESQKENEAEEKNAENGASHSTDNRQNDKPCENGGKKEWKGPKGILFTRTRESTAALVDWIKETKELNAVLRPEPLVGSQDGNIGMTQHEQERVIRRFHTGETNLLLATSVAEEGLDIRDCNYVIRYDMMGNEISTVQSRGRVRADEGKYSVLVGQDSGALKREYTNWFQESLMIEALSRVQGMDQETFEQQVKAIQQKNFQDRYIKKRLFATMKSVHLPHDVTFRCRKCNMEACQAHDIRKINGSQHVVINSDFKNSKVDIKKHPNPKTIDNIVFNNKIYCKDCHEDWGVTALITGVEWMCIKICSFVLEFPGQSPQRRMFKKWKDLPFGIAEATIEEILQQAKDGAPDDIEFFLSL